MIRYALTSLGPKVAECVRQEAPERTGALRESISWGVSGLTLEITEGVSYGLYVRMGTRPHLIFPRYARALWWPGLDHPVAYVHHPGTKKDDYAERGLMSAIDSGAIEEAENLIGAQIDFEFVQP